jgi:hypothetical protein
VPTYIVSEINYKGVAFTLSDDDRPSLFVLGVRKSGSSILNNMVKALAAVHGYGVCEVGMLFLAGLTAKDWRFDPALASLVRGGNVYCGFRDLPVGLKSAPAFVASPKVLLVRDPRDALVSTYFSDAYSHLIPAEGAGRDYMLGRRSRALSMTLEPYVLREARDMARTMMEYAPLLSDPLLKLYRYEDVIFEKRKLMESISTHFGWPIHSQGIGLILEWADVVPAKEQPTEFIRRVRPGDHKDKLSADTIGKLNEILAEPLKVFGYAP